MRKISLKIISLVLMLVFVMSFSVSALDVSVLERMSVITSAASDNMTVTREMLAKAVAHMVFPKTDFNPKDTVFKDVTKDNKYSGEISALADSGVLSGVGDGLFAPKSVVCTEQVAKVLVSILGYDAWAQAKGGYPYGYMSVASDLGLFDGVSIKDNNLLLGDLKIMLVNVLATPVPDKTFVVQNGEYYEQLVKNKHNPTFAQKYLSIYEYEVNVKKVSVKDYTITAEITDADENAPNSAGKTVLFSASNKIEIKSFENAPAVIVADEDDNIIDIKLSKKAEIKYGVIDSVNNVKSEKPFYTSHLKYITLKGDDTDYEFSESCKIILNEKDHFGEIGLYGRYVKFITYDDEIICLETWDLTDGGIFSEFDRDYIMYKDGNIDVKLTSLSTYNELYVIIDGESRNKTEIKKGSLFSYYKNEETQSLVVVATEKKMTDKLKSINVSSEILNFGNMAINYADPYYVLKDGVYVEGNSQNISVVLNNETDVLFDVYGNAKYLSLSSEKSSDVVLGYFVGAETDTFGETKIRIFDIEKDDVILKDYVLKENAEFLNGITKAEFLAAADASDGSGIFEFSITSKNEISRVSVPYKFEGFKTAVAKPTSFIDDDYIYAIVDGRNLYFDNDAPIIAVYKDNGNYVIKHYKYSDIRGGYCSGVTMRFYGYKDSSKVRFITLTGDLLSTTSSQRYGILTKMHLTVDENGDEVYGVTINDREFTVSKENAVASGMKENMLVSYATMFFETGEAVISGGIDVSDDMENWAGRSFGSMSVVCGTVKRADDKRIVLDDGRDYYYNPKRNSIYRMNSNHKFTSSEYRELIPGSRVAVVVISNEAYCVIGG